MLTASEYSNHRDSYIEKHHSDSLVFQFSAGGMKRRLEAVGINLFVTSSSYFLDSGGCSAVLLSVENNFIDIWIDTRQINQLSDTLGYLPREVFAAAALHEVGHVQSWGLSFKDPDFNSDNESVNELQAWALAEQFSEALTGYPVNGAFIAVRNRCLGLLPKPAAPKPTAPETKQSEDDFWAIAQHLEKLIADIESQQIRKKAAAVAPRKAPKKRDFVHSLAPTGHHALEAHHPQITVGGSVAIFT